MIREGQKMTQKRLAEVSGVPRICINRYENGIYRPNMENARKLAIALGVTIDELLGNGEQEKPA